MHSTIQELSTLAASDEAAARQHRLTLDGLFDEAILAFERSSASGFSDKEALRLSLDCFHRMIAHDSGDQRPYTFVGYVCYLMDRLDDAENYLRHAHSLNPDEPDTVTLLNLIAKEREGVVFKTYRSDLPRAEQRIDLAALYSELAGFVQVRLRKLYQVDQAQPAEGDALNRLRESSAELEGFISACQGAIGILREAYTDDELDMLMQPLLSRQAQLVRRRQHAEQVLGLRRRLGEATQTADRLIKEVRSLRTPADMARFEAVLEACYDECDALADLLDALAGQGTDILALEKSYERLLRFVRQAQDAFSERSR